MAVLRLYLALGALSATQAVTPIEKVLTLLEDLKTDIVAQGTEEATAYDKFACFCKDTTKEKSKSIEEGQDKIDSTTADIAEKNATKMEKITDLGKERVKVEETTILLQKATETYEKEKATYDATITDLSKALSSTKKALKVLKAAKASTGGAAFLELGQSSDVHYALDLADALGLVDSSKKEAVTAFIQQAKVDPEDPEYKFHSDKIIKIIEELEKDFSDKKSEVEKEWEKTDTAYKEEKADMEEKITTAKEQIEKLKGEIADLTAEISDLKEELVTAEDNLKDDSAYLKDLTTRCESKAQVWDQITSTRHEEVEAITQALEILKSDKVKDADEVNKRVVEKKPKTEAVPELLSTKAKVAAKAPPAKAAQSKAKATTFLQVARAHATSQSGKESAAEFLTQEGIRLKSMMLSSVASQVAKDPFVKVKKLIQDLLEKMLAQAKAEATKKGFCDTELGTAYNTREAKFNEINKLDADLSELDAKKIELKEEIKELGEEVEDLKTKLKEATELRETEKATNEETLKKAGEGAVAVGEAIVILKDFYKQSAKAAVLLQVSASPVDEDDPGAGFSGSYKGQQSGSKPIIGLLEVLESDFKRTVRKTEAAEKKAQAEFVLFDRTSKEDIAAKETAIELDKQDLTATESAYDDAMKDLKSATKVLDTTLKGIEDLKPTCLDTGMSYAERVKKREDEIAALEKALKILSP
jgi:predicted  nucleic acid-binding Zn-ribbon protein